MSKTKKFDLGPTGDVLQQMAEWESLDGGYGEFDIIVAAILASRMGLSLPEFQAKYTYEQESLTSPAYVTPIA